MVGEGEYNLDDFRQIKVTESYLGMDGDTKECQNEEPLHNCTTRQYMETLLDECECLPLNLRTSKEVLHMINLLSINSDTHLL